MNRVKLEAVSGQEEKQKKGFDIRKSKWGMGLIVSIPILLAILKWDKSVGIPILAVFCFIGSWEIHKNIVPNIQTSRGWKRVIAITSITILILPMVWVWQVTENWNARFLLFVGFNNFITDTGAYAFGKALSGRLTKLAPKISPRKTWGGALFGILSSIVFCYFVARPWLLNHEIIPFDNITIITLIILGCIGNVLGDLGGSFFKRIADVKDSSQMLGEAQGGIFDKLGGFAMCLYFYIAFFLFFKNILIPQDLMWPF